MNSLSQLLSGLRGALAESAAAKKPNLAYEALFSRSNGGLSEAFYAKYGISGATFLAADSHAQKLVILHRGAQEAGDPYLRLQVPIRESPGDESIGRDLKSREYDDLAHRLFLYYREQQGIGAYHRAISFDMVPEIYSEIAPDLSEAREEKRAEDWLYIDQKSMEFYVICWRAIWVGIERFGGDAPLEDLIENMANSVAPRRKAGSKRFTDEYFAGLGISGPNEGWIAQLDRADGEAWNMAAHAGKERQTWTELRNMVDQLGKGPLSGETKLGLYPGLTGLKTDELQDRIWRALERLSKPNDSNEEGCPSCESSLKVCLDWLHSSAPLPIPSYFYYGVIDGIPKEHLVLPLLRSEKAPLVFHQRGEVRKHSVVFACLVALNGRGHGERRAPEELVELQTILRVAAEPMIDQIFVGGLTRPHETAAKRFHRRFVKASRPSNSGCPENTFILGTFDSRVSFVAQQTRALTLMHSLFESSTLNSESSIAVIGGGVGGVTAATAALLQGCKQVLLFERGSELMHLQAKASHRYLMPYVLDWPDAGCEEQWAILPVLSWKADSADKVIGVLRKQFRKIKEAFERELTVKKRADVFRVFAGSDESRKMNIVYRKGKTEHRDCVDALIVCAGFGKDVPLVNDATDAYWTCPKNDDRLSHISSAGRRKKILVSGNGDGALIDLARAALRMQNQAGDWVPFQHGPAMGILLNDPEVQKRIRPVVDLMRGVDELADAGAIKRVNGRPLLLPEYSKRLRGEAGAEYEEFQEVFFKNFEVRKDTKVWLNTTSEAVFRTDTALIHRLVAFLLIDQEKVEPRFFDLKEDCVSKKGDKWIVETRYASNHKKGDARTFDQLVLRHGPLPPRKRLAEIDNLEEVYRDFDVIRALDLYTELERSVFLDYLRLSRRALGEDGHRY